MEPSMNSPAEIPDISHSRRVGAVNLCPPTPQDGYALNQLVAANPPLDPNSVYCNLLQCTHFSETSLAAKHHNELVGFVSGYVLPAQPNTLFIWQVVVVDAARGQGLAKRMLLQLVRNLASRKIQFIHTTITPDNLASWALFRSLARELKCGLENHVFFARETHFGGLHDDEHLVRLGPLSSGVVAT
jgi:L-2,4-diaminobutyric acid acetyltransferase